MLFLLLFALLSIPLVQAASWSFLARRTVNVEGSGMKGTGRVAQQVCGKGSKTEHWLLVTRLD